MTTTIRNYDTSAALNGQASAELIAESERAEPTGAVPAHRDESGTWQYVQPSDVTRMERLGHTVVTVYAEN